MRKTLRAAALCTLMSSTAAWADDRIPSPPADLVLAYSHPTLPPPLNTRLMSVASDGAVAAYMMQVPVADPVPDGNRFMPNGAPTLIAQGARIMVVDLRTRQSTRICPAQGNDWDPVWSPDGRRLAFYSDRAGLPQLWVYDRGSQACRRVSDLRAKSLLWAHEEPRWSPDGTRIHFAVWPEQGPASMSEALVHIGPNSAPEAENGAIHVYRHDPAAASTGRAAAGTARGDPDSFEVRCNMGGHLGASLAVAPADGEGPTRLIVDSDVQSAAATDNRHFPTPYQRLSASGRWLTYFDTFCFVVGDVRRVETRLFAVPVTGGTPILVADHLRHPMGGAENILNYRWHPMRDELVYARDGRMWRVTFNQDGPSAPERVGEALGALSPGIHWYSQDGSMVLVGTNIAVQPGIPNRPFGYDVDLALVPVAGGAPVRIAIDRQRWSIEGVVARDDRALLQPGPTSFRMHARDRTTGEAVVLTFDWRTGQMRETWRGRGRFHDIQQAGAGRMVGVYEDFRTAANLFTYSDDLTNPVRLTDVSPALNGAASMQVEMIETTIPNYQGGLQTVRSAILLPPGARRGDRLPAVVWFYPGSDLTTRLEEFGAPGMGDPAYPLTSRGYAVILTNVVTGPGNERGHVIDEIMDSLMPQVHRAADLGYVDINRLAIRGHSFGGYGTAAVIARTNLFRAAIPSAGVYDLGGSYADVDFILGAPEDRSRWSETSQPRQGQPVWSDPLRYIENSPYYLADRIRTPVLILQGTEDFTGAREGGKLFAALRRLNRPVELALYQGGSHVPAYWQPAQAVDQMARTIEFLQRHIGPGWTADQRSARAD